MGGSFCFAAAFSGHWVKELADKVEIGFQFQQKYMRAG
jgi:hypothetical protein